MPRIHCWRAHAPDPHHNFISPHHHQAVFSLTRLALPLLEASGTASDPARVLNVGSIDGLRVGLVDHFAYSASKAALHRLTQVRKKATILKPANH